MRTADTEKEKLMLQVSGPRERWRKTSAVVFWRKGERVLSSSVFRECKKLSRFPGLAGRLTLLLLASALLHAQSAYLYQPADGTAIAAGQSLTYTMYGYSPDYWSSWSDYLILEVSPTYGQQPWNSTCNVQYQPLSNTVYLTLDNGYTWASGALGSGGVLSNSQCSVNLSGGSASGGGGGLKLSLPITFSSNYTGTKYNYIAVYQNGFSWFYFGTITISQGGPTQFYLTTSASPAGAGTISPSSGSYASGSVVTVTATASSGWQFSGFSGALSGTANPQNLTITGNLSVTANFTQSQGGSTQTITTSPPGLGLIVDGIGCTSPCNYQWATGTNHTISATIAQTAGGTQYLFSNWSDGWPATRTITASSSATTYTANFAARVPVYGGVSPSPLEVNLGSVPIDLYDGTSANSYLPSCSPSWRTRACLQYFLSRYAIEGVTGVRFMFNATSWPSTALTGPGNVSGTWAANLLNFFNDLKAYGITNITPTPSWDDFGAALSGPYWAPYLSNPGCPSGGKSLKFAPLLPYGADPNDGNNPDGGNDPLYISNKCLLLLASESVLLGLVKPRGAGRQDRCRRQDSRSQH